MEEKKLTDEANRFLLDLRCCIYHNCAFCSQWNNGFEEDDCREEMLNRAKNFIHRLQDENTKQKAEIERLEKDVHDMSWIIKIHKYCVGADHCQNSSMKEFKLQKQVDELKEELENKKAEEGEIYKWAKNNIFGGVE